MGAAALSVSNWRPQTGQAICSTLRYITIFISIGCAAGRKTGWKLCRRTACHRLPWVWTRPFRRVACLRARFRVYSRNKDTGALTLKGNSIWQPGPLRETTRFVEDGRSLRAIVDDTLAEGNDVCIGIIGADEAGNVQCRAYDAIQYESDFGGTNPISYISIPTEDRGTKPRANEAIDTAVRVNLIHEYYNDKQDTVETIGYGATHASRCRLWWGNCWTIRFQNLMNTMRVWPAVRA